MGLCHPQSFSSDAKRDMGVAISNQTDVSFMLTKHVFSGKIKGHSNLVFSPLSIQLVLGLIAVGSKGPTHDQLLCFLRSKSIDELNSLYSYLVNVVFADGSSNGGPRLSVANGVWIDRSLPFKPSFKKVVDKVYKASSISVDFQNKVGPLSFSFGPLAVEVSKLVNQWADQKTNGLIKEILHPSSVNNTTRLILANTLYFKGAWKEKFNASDTTEHEFHLLSGGSVQAPFMTSTNEQFVKEFKGFKVLRLPYNQGNDNNRQFSIYFFLPNANNGLPALIDKVSSKSGFLKKHLPTRKVEVGKFLIPKFKTSFGFEASTILKRLGLMLPFSEGGLVDMVDSLQANNLVVSDIFHKSFVEVNEDGTEAAAVTASMLLMCAAPVNEYKIDFVADHPFMFLIREDTTLTVLFIGTLLNPLVN